jgi:proline dehydrogenase
MAVGAGYDFRRMYEIARRALLWASRNRWLKARLPRYRFMQRAVRRFMPGETVENAFAAAAPLQARDRIRSEYTRLGENLTDPSEADAVADHYLGVYDGIRERGLEGEVSVKLTQLGLDLDAEATYDHCVRLATRATEIGSWFWIDMEDSSYVDRTLTIFERLRRDGHQRTGVCLQSYLRRTPADIERLLPLQPAIRMVKGAYDEKADVAFRTRGEVDAAFVSESVTLLRAGGVRVGLGTHDVRLIEQIAAEVAAAGIGRDAFEVQMLYGIRADQQRRLAREGYRVRVLIAYGEAWYPWYVRRLAERPANVFFALRQLLP